LTKLVKYLELSVLTETITWSRKEVRWELYSAETKLRPRSSEFEIKELWDEHSTEKGIYRWDFYRKSKLQRFSDILPETELTISVQPEWPVQACRH
jgi:hypothetical protein